MQEVEALIRAKQEEMERSTLTVKEEKQRLLEMKRMKDDARQASALVLSRAPSQSLFAARAARSAIGCAVNPFPVRPPPAVGCGVGERF